jgi:hypothetical protein
MIARSLPLLPYRLFTALILGAGFHRETKNHYGGNYEDAQPANRLSVRFTSHLADSP